VVTVEIKYIETIIIESGDMNRKSSTCKSDCLEHCNVDDNVTDISKKMLCCALYRPADVVRKLSKDTLIYDNDFEGASCWHCAHKFSSTAWQFPIGFDSSASQYEAIGNFCSPSCAAAWGDVHYHHNMAQHMSWLRALAMEQGIQDFSCSPPTHWLKEFGGNLTIEEFRDLGSSNKIIVEKTLPFVSIPIVLERECTINITEAKEVTRQLKAQNKKATSQAMNSENITSRGLYHEFIEKNNKLEEPPRKKMKSSTAKKKKKDVSSRESEEENTKGTLKGLFKKRSRDKT
tara:strand:- start:2566 stop:3432 length:867 start_codon:yes stop_codon:yes gene_type:complete